MPLTKKQREEMPENIRAGCVLFCGIALLILFSDCITQEFSDVRLSRTQCISNLRDRFPETGVFNDCMDNIPKLKAQGFSECYTLFDADKFKIPTELEDCLEQVKQDYSEESQSPHCKQLAKDASDVLVRKFSGDCK